MTTLLKKSNILPLLLVENSLQPIAYWKGRPISRMEFIRHVDAVCAQLKNRRYAINVCEDRYKFMVGFAAVMMMGQTNLLPSSRVQKEILDVSKDYKDSYVLTDADEAMEGLEICRLAIPENDVSDHVAGIPDIASDHLAAIVFTSGSTGKSRPNLKYWGQLVAGSALAAERFGLDGNTDYSIIATVSPQHMYGLETSILLPMLTRSYVHGGKPFYPADIMDAIASMPVPRILVSTPVHLRACTLVDLEWPETEFVLSATAPLARELAVRIADSMKTDVREIYGCTEAGSVASRNTLRNNEWLPYDSFYFRKKGDTQYLCAPHLHEEIEIHDNVELLVDGRFRLSGRNSDILNIAGKRGSLGDLNIKLNQIDGVTDGVFFLPDPDDNQEKITRLVAFVIAHDLSDAEIMAQLSGKMDPVFLPRPIFRVDRLPYSEIGKLTRKNLNDLYLKLKNR